MEQKRKFPRWIIVLAVIVLVCAGVKVWYDRLCYGEIDISDSAPSKEMLLHILEHADELAAREDLFSHGTHVAGHTYIAYIGNPDLENSYIWLNDSSDAYGTYAYYRRYRDPNFFNFLTPWSDLEISFSACAPGILLVINDYDAPVVSDAPLREMMSAIESVIGRP